MGVIDDETLHAQSNIEIALAVVGDAAHTVGYLANLLGIDEFVFMGEGIIMVYTAIIVG